MSHAVLTDPTFPSLPLPLFRDRFHLLRRAFFREGLNDYNATARHFNYGRAIEILAPPMTIVEVGMPYDPDHECERNKL